MQTKGLSEVRVIGMGIVAGLGGMAVLFVTTIIVAYLVTLGMFAVVPYKTALKVADNGWYSRGLSIGTTIGFRSDVGFGVIQTADKNPKSKRNLPGHSALHGAGP